MVGPGGPLRNLDRNFDVDFGSNIGGAILGGLCENLSLVIGFNKFSEESPPFRAGEESRGVLTFTEDLPIRSS
jgi:hypothetical protein